MKHYVFETQGRLDVTSINEDQDFEAMLGSGQLPFTQSDKFRLIDVSQPQWPIEHWGSTFLETGVMPDLGPYVPQEPLISITRAQLIDVLLDRDVYEDQVTALLEAADYGGQPEPVKAKARALNAWKNANHYRPDHPLIAQMRLALNLTDQATFEALWRAAQNREV